MLAVLISDGWKAQSDPEGSQLSAVAFGNVCKPVYRISHLNQNLIRSFTFDALM